MVSLSHAPPSLHHYNPQHYSHTFLNQKPWLYTCNVHEWRHIYSFFLMQYWTQSTHWMRRKPHVKDMKSQKTHCNKMSWINHRDRFFFHFLKHTWNHQTYTTHCYHAPDNPKMLRCYTTELCTSCVRGASNLHFHHSSFLQLFTVTRNRHKICKTDNDICWHSM
jgi:hypothetical protein